MGSITKLDEEIKFNRHWAETVFSREPKNSIIWLDEIADQ